MQTQTDRETKAQRRQRLLSEHYAKCEALAKRLGWKKTDGKKVSVGLLKVERIAHAGACRMHTDLGGYGILSPDLGL